MKTSPIQKLYNFNPSVPPGDPESKIPAKELVPIGSGSGTESDPYVFEYYPSEKVQRAEKWILSLNTTHGIYNYEIINRERNKTGKRVIDRLTLEVSIFDDSVDFRDPLEVYFDVTKAVK